MSVLLVGLAGCASFAAESPADPYLHLPVAKGFDWPVGAPEAEGYYDAQPFGKNNHLGEDWNGNGGGNTDLGDPVMAVAYGEVVFAEDLKGGWGNVVRVVHHVRVSGKETAVESVYAHLDRIDVAVGDEVKRGQYVGTIGNAHGEYLAHLHFEMRSIVGMPIGPGYSYETGGYLDPSAFIREHRP